MAYKPKLRASICAFGLEMKGYFDRLESLNMVFDAELSINIILSGLPADYNQFVLLPLKVKSNHGSKRKAESEIAPTSDPKEAVCFYCNTKGHWRRSYLKYLKDPKDGKVEKSSHSGKMTKSPFTGSCERGEALLDLVHTDVCGPFRSSTKDGNRYYVMFTDSFSRKIQVLRSDRGGEYLSIKFFDHLKTCATLLLSFWGYALETAAHILNRVPTKKVSKTPFEMWKGKRPSLGHIKIWGCEVFVRREAQDKLEARSKKCLFFDYLEESFGYLFYKPKDNVVFVARRGVFYKREMISKEDSGSKIDLEEIQESADEEPIVNTDT
ncbi:retrotransposon protein, putative, ty1-copia subclass [Tanacetum coccineum]